MAKEPRTMTAVSAKNKERARAARAAELEARLAVNLPITTHRALKARAAEQGVSIRDYILQMLRKQGIG
jgi:predicted HicB family RNase H-like nuclease